MCRTTKSNIYIYIYIYIYRDLAFSFEPDKDPEITFNVPVLKRYCQEVYKAALPPKHRSTAGIPLGALAQGVSSFFASQASLPKFANGPLSALLLALDKAEWKAKGPFELVSRDGVAFHLPTVCPSRVVTAFKNDLHQVIIHRAVVKLHASKGTDEMRILVERGLFFKPLLSAYCKLGQISKRILVGIVSGGTFTNSFLQSIGYDIDPVCEACGDAQDNVVHRCFTCVHVEAKAKQALGSSFHNVIVLGGSDSLYARALIPKPVLLSAPSKITVYDTIGMGADDVFSVVDGEVFGDGSCTNPSDAPLARSGFASVQVCPQGNIVKAIYA